MCTEASFKPKTTYCRGLCTEVLEETHQVSCLTVLPCLAQFNTGFVIVSARQAASPAWTAAPPGMPGAPSLAGRCSGIATPPPSPRWHRCPPWSRFPRRSMPAAPRSRAASAPTLGAATTSSGAGLQAPTSQTRATAASEDALICFIIEYELINQYYGAGTNCCGQRMK